MTHDNFRNHSDDWSRVPRPESPGRTGYGLDASHIRSREISADLIRGTQAYVPYEAVAVKPQLSVGLAYVLWLLFGLLGAHYFYIGRIGLGVLWLLTGGLLGIGWVIDLFTLKGQVERINARG